MSLLCLPNSLKSLIRKIQSTHFLNSFHCYQLPQAIKRQIAAALAQHSRRKICLSQTQITELHTVGDSLENGMCYAGGQSRPLIPSPFQILLITSRLISRSSLPFFLFPPYLISQSLLLCLQILMDLLTFLGWSTVNPKCGLVKEQKSSLNSEFLLQVQVSGFLLIPRSVRRHCPVCCIRRYYI